MLKFGTLVLKDTTCNIFPQIKYIMMISITGQTMILNIQFNLYECIFVSAMIYETRYIKIITIYIKGMYAQKMRSYKHSSRSEM